MNVRKTLEIALDDEALEMLQDGESLQVPVDQDQSIVIYPPREHEDGEMR